MRLSNKSTVYISIWNLEIKRNDETCIDTLCPWSLRKTIKYQKFSFADRSIWLNIRCSNYNFTQIYKWFIFPVKFLAFRIFLEDRSYLAMKVWCFFHRKWTDFPSIFISQRNWGLDCMQNILNLRQRQHWFNWCHVFYILLFIHC